MNSSVALENEHLISQTELAVHFKMSIFF